MRSNFFGKIENAPTSLYFTYEKSGGDFVLETTKITYNSSTKKLEKIEEPGETSTKNMTTDDEKRFIEKLNSIDFFNLKEKYLAEKVPVGVYTFHLFVFIVHQSTSGLAMNSIQSVIWQTGSDAPKSLFSLSEFIETL